MRRALTYLSLAWLAGCGSTSLEGDASIPDTHADSHVTDVVEDPPADDVDIPEGPCSPGTYLATYEYGDLVRSIVETTACRYLVSSIELEPALMLVDDRGGVVWRKASSLLPNAIAAMPDGGAVIAGNDTIGRIDPEGNLIWAGRLGDASDPYTSADIHDLLVTGDGHIVAAGALTYSRWEPVTILVLALDPGGDLLWQKTYTSDRCSSATSIAQTADRGFLVAGNECTSCDGPVPCSGFQLLGLDPTGEVRFWWRFEHDANQPTVIGIGETPDDGHILAAKWGRDVLWAMGLDPEGTISWQSGARVTLDLGFSSLITMDDGSFVLTGASWDDLTRTSLAWAVRMDRDGVLWQRSYELEGRHTTLMAGLSTPAGLLLAGGTGDEWSGEDSMLIELDPRGLVSSTCPPGIGAEAPSAPLSTDHLPIDIPGEVSDTTFSLDVAPLTVTPTDMAAEILCSG
jgi:hypothetical protein